MNRGEAATLLTLCAAFDRRTLGDSDVQAWADILTDVNYADATLAVKAHYTKTREFVMPSDVRAGVRRIRADRLERTVMPDPPRHIDADNAREFLEWQRATSEAIADGTYAPPPGPKRIERGIGEDHPHALRGVFQRMPKADAS